MREPFIEIVHFRIAVWDFSHVHQKTTLSTVFVLRFDLRRETLEKIMTVKT